MGSKASTKGRRKSIENGHLKTNGSKSKAAQCRNYITASYYAIILRNDITELYYGIIFVKSILGMPGTSPAGAPGIPGIPWARPGTPGDAHGTPLGPPGTRLEPQGMFLGTSLRPLGTPPGTPGDLQAHLMDLLWTTKTLISRQIDSARSSRFLRSKLPMRAHRQQHSTRPFSL